MYPGSRGFLAVKRRDKREKEAARENLRLQVMLISLSCYDRCQWTSRESINRQPITTHLWVNKSQSEYAYKLPPIRRQGHILSLVQVYWHGKINQLSWVTRGFSHLLSLSLSLLRDSSLREPLAPRVVKMGLLKEFSIWSVCCFELELSLKVAILMNCLVLCLNDISTSFSEVFICNKVMLNLLKSLRHVCMLCWHFSCQMFLIQKIQKRTKQRMQSLSGQWCVNIALISPKYVKYINGSVKLLFLPNLPFATERIVNRSVIYCSFLSCQSSPLSLLFVAWKECP